MTHYHPSTDKHGRLVELLEPSQPTNFAAWTDAAQIATVVPGAAMPTELLGISVRSWLDAPTQASEWAELAKGAKFAEPALKITPGKRPASGVVVLEPDGRVWVVSPSNRYAGYTNTFPKGTIGVEDSLSPRANAIKEAFEESGLKIGRAHV